MKKQCLICQCFLFLCVCVLPATLAQAATYISASATYNWVDSSTHTKVGYNTPTYKLTAAAGCGTTPPILDDTLSDLLPIGFNFTYGVTVYTQVRIQTNGRLQFGNATCGSGTQSVGPPQTYPYGYPDGNMNNTMKVFGVDLDSTNLVDKPNYPTAASKTNCLSTATCYISFATIGTSPNRQFVVTWKGVPEWVTASNTSGTFDLQVILNEDGTFVYQYGAIVHGGTGKAQVGWQLSNTDYQVTTFGAALEPTAGSAIKFFKPLPVALYQFEEGAWAPGVAGQVADASGNSRTGTALGGAQETTAGYVCRGANIPSNTSAGTVDAIKTGVSLKNGSVNMIGTGTINFWYNSALPWTGGTAKSAQLLDATATDGQWFYLSKTATGTLYFQITDSTGAVFQVETPVQAIAANTWTHIAIAWNLNGLAGVNQDKLSIFVNAGAATVSAFTSNGTINATADFIHLGDNPSGYTGTKGSVNSAGGVIDEVRMYNYEMVQAEVAVAKAATHACPVFAYDHLELIHANWSGISCAAGTLMVKACANAACSATYAGGTTATLYALSGSSVSWVPTGDPSAAITAGNASVNKDLYVDTGSATLWVGATGAANVPVCRQGASVVPCTWTSVAAGLKLTAPATITGGLPASVKVEAVESGAASPRVCTPIAGISGASLKVWSTAGTPAPFPAQTVSAGANVGGSPQVANAEAGTYSLTPTALPASDNVTGLSFDANAATTLWINHMDVGSWTLNARLDRSSTGSTPAFSFSGSTGMLTLPVGYGISASTVKASGTAQTDCGAAPSVICDATAASESQRGVAGVGFSSTVTAALYSSGSTDLANNPVAPSYAGDVALAPSLRAPNGGAAGALDTTSVTLAGGTKTIASQKWTQSGAMRIAASGIYQGANISGLSAVLGRFVPNHFDTVVTPGCGFTYSGQPISVVTVNAMDGASPSVLTPNYQGGFAKDVVLSDANGVSGAMTSASVLAAGFNGTTKGQGQASPVFTFMTAGPTPTVTYLPPATIKLRASDGEVSSSGGTEATKEIRSGRLMISNAFGSELLPLPVPLQVQYLSAGGWVKNVQDSCTSFIVPTSANGGLLFAAAAPPKNALAAGDTTATLGATAAAGSGLLRLSAPGTAHAGYVDVAASVVGPSWFAPGVNGRACFGVCGPRSPVIYLRERF